jgi:hypothetical protein
MGKLWRNLDMIDLLIHTCMVAVGSFIGCILAHYTNRRNS